MSATNADQSATKPEVPKSTVNDIVKTTVASEIFASALNGDDYTKKNDYINQLDQRFSSTPESTELTAKLDSIKHDPHSTRRGKSELTRVEKTISEFKDGRLTTKQVAEFLKIDLPTKAANSVLNTKLQEKKTEITKSIDAAADVRNQHQSAAAALKSAHDEFKKAEKSKYTIWKSEMQESNGTDVSTKKSAEAKYTTVYQMLRDNLDSAGDNKDLFELYINLDEVKSNSYRISRAGQIVAYVASEVAREYVTVSQVTQGDKFKNALDGNAATTRPTELTPDDLVKSDFTKMKFSYLMDNHVIRYVRNTEGVLDNIPGYLDANRTTSTAILSGVTKYLDFNKIVSSEEYRLLLTSVVAEVCVILGESLRYIIQTHGTISTVKLGMFDSFFVSHMVPLGLDYAPLREQFAALW